MTSSFRAKTIQKPQAWVGVVTVPVMGSVAGYMQAHATVDYDPPTVEVIPVARGDYSHGDHLDVRLLHPGDRFFCDETHAQLVLQQLGEAMFRLDPEDQHLLVAEFSKPVLLIWWRQLGLILADSDAPPPAHFRLMKLTDKREIEIPRSLQPSLVRVLRSQGAATRWARRRADALLARYTVNRDRLRLSRTA